MKKFAKMSLVAAVAVAGMTSTVSAKPLEEAIKGVDVSGYVRYRWTETNVDASNAGGTDSSDGVSSSTNEYKASMTVTAPVNDMVKATTAFYAVGTTTDDANGTNDADVGVNLSKAYFTFNAGPATVMAGKHQMGTPFTNAADNRGTGATALVNAGPATVAVAHFTNNNIDTSSSDELVNVSNTGITVAAVIAAVGPVKGQLWYAQTSKGVATSTTDGQTNDVDAYAVLLNGKFGPVNVDVNYSALDFNPNGATTEENSQLHVVASANVGPANVALGYVTTDDSAANGAGTTKGGLVSFDVDAATNFKVEQLSANGTNDAELFYVAAGATVANVALKLEHATGDYKANRNSTAKTDADETKISAVYSMSPNFKITAWHSMLETSLSGVTTDTDKSRLEIKYTF